MAENLPNNPTPTNPFRKPDAEPIVVDAEFLIRQTFAEDARRGYELLFRRYYRTLCSQAVRFVHSRTVAEDLVSDVFFSFWKNQVHQQITSSYQAYLYMAVRKRAYTHMRLEFQQNPSPLQAETEPIEFDGSPDPEQLLQYTELYQRIEETVRTLPPQCQRVFVMSRFEGKKHREIADELQISPKTIEAHLSRALTQLRQTLRMGLFFWLALLVFTNPTTQPILPASAKTSAAE
ncbi:RNA polymerase sigma-70 factor [Spirosoma sp. KCTC 42546]|uniref:RNA polymerase sigma-70 factor n=1 Tax=Spirosoma sp. KCTC 42546 TaxID=2520506 RepID=UPI00115A76B8|nr:RNA polymerase sigma-70 factor [Spirosoma sp. KCTC 42546]QDK82080.1 RNA polymerase sigma-70 factor [Spirosoma sp. KCTC 42546]